MKINSGNIVSLCGVISKTGIFQTTATLSLSTSCG